MGDGAVGVETNSVTGLDSDVIRDRARGVFITADSKTRDVLDWCLIEVVDRHAHMCPFLGPLAAVDQARINVLVRIVSAKSLRVGEPSRSRGLTVPVGNAQAESKG